MSCVLVRALVDGLASSPGVLLLPSNGTTELRLGGPAATVSGVVLDQDGRIAETLDLPGPVPRPVGWRATPDYRLAVERAALALERTLETSGGPTS